MPSRKSVFACVAWLLAMLAARPAQAGFCMNTGSRQEGAKVFRLFKHEAEELNAMTLKRCEFAKERCVECVRDQNEIRSYVGLCTEHTAVYQNIQHTTCIDSTPCAKANSQDACSPKLTGMIGTRVCQFVYSINGQVMNNGSTYCTGECGTAVIYVQRKVYALTSCSKYSFNWLENFKRNNTNVRTNFCDKSESCSIVTSVNPIWDKNAVPADAAAVPDRAEPGQPQPTVPAAIITTAQVGAKVEPVVPRPVVTERSQKTSARTSSASNAGTPSSAARPANATKPAKDGAALRPSLTAVAAILAALGIAHLLL